MVTVLSEMAGGAFPRPSSATADYYPPLSHRKLPLWHDGARQLNRCRNISPTDSINMSGDGLSSHLAVAMLHSKDKVS